jgi:hypothetical protein
MEKMIFTPCEEEAWPEFPHLVYFRSEEGRLYFDATHCLEHSRSSGEFGIGDFRERLAFEIDALCEGFQISCDEFFVENAENGHQMVAECGEFLFASYIDKWLIPYLYLRIREMFTVGFTVGDELIRELYRERFGKED